MSNLVIPIAERERRMPVAGRIRIGQQVATKGGRTRPDKLEHFRLTSHDRRAIEQVAQVYGGRPEQWGGAPGKSTQWQVTTEATELRVWLPPGDPLHQAYELWSGGGCQRRCDGVTAVVAATTSPDDAEQVERPCPCNAAGEQACDLTTRLSVLLPEVRFGGVWRLDSKGINAGAELPGMVDTIRMMQGDGVTPVAVLALEQRTSGGKHYAVPVLRPDGSLEQLVRGELTASHRLGTTTGTAPLLDAGEVEAELIPDPDDLHSRVEEWAGGDGARIDQVVEWLGGRGVKRIANLDVDGLVALDVQLDAWGAA